MPGSVVGTFSRRPLRGSKASAAGGRAPVRVRRRPVGEGHLDEASDVCDQLKAAGYRVDIGEPTETIGKRIRASELEKIPFAVVFGDRESEASLAIRERGGGQTEQSLADFLAKLATLDS